MHIHIKPFRFILSNKTQNRNKEGSMKKKPKKDVALRFLFSKFRSWVKLLRYQPLIHHKYVTIKEQPKKTNQLCILGFLVRVTLDMKLEHTESDYASFRSIKHQQFYQKIRTYKSRSLLR